MRTDTSERGLERLICTALTGHACDPRPAGAVAEVAEVYGDAGWVGGDPQDYDRERQPRQGENQAEWNDVRRGRRAKFRKLR